MPPQVRLLSTTWPPICAGALVLVAIALCASARGRAAAETVEVEPVWSAHPVGFSLLTDGRDQFVGYYDASRQMSVAHRKLPSPKWTFCKLPRRTGWDSHNYVTMVMDSAGHLHLCGDMHCARMVYFRTTRPGDITSLKRIGHMVGPERERRVTYPVFLRAPDGRLIFRYRDGGSGNGDDLYNVYDAKTRTWQRLFACALISGQGKMNAYCTRPALGPDGRFHMVWVWRDTPDAATNHDLSYARSRDLVHWETSAGRPLKLPITIENAEVIDPVPARGGMVNGNTRLGFDSHKRPIVTYHKFDSERHTQIYSARLEDGRWRIYQTSDWAGYRWQFGGGGAIPFEVRVGGVQALGDGTLALSYRYKHGSGTWVLDEKTLRPIPGRTAPKRPGRDLPPSVRKVESKFPGMSKRITADSGRCDEPGVRYVLAWETLGPHRDRPRKGKLPQPSMLRVIKLVAPPER